VIVPGFAEFHDAEDAPFYCSSVPAIATPQATAAEILRCFSDVVFGVLESARRRPRPMELDDLVRWHRATFRSTFPYQAGVVRSAPTWFGVRWREASDIKRRTVKGTDPSRVREQLRAVFRAYNAELEARPPQQRSFREALTAAAQLYAELLRIHPFEDGNLRAAFPALQGALVSLGAAPVHFERAVAEHDEAVGWALRPGAEQRTLGPFVELLARRTEEAAAQGWRGVP
jgi:fido (protein-threonine AMPylation protein)